MLAVVAPGQGAQRPGQLSAWLDLPGVAEQVDAAGAAAGVDLAAAGTSWDADRITATEVAQPLVVTTSLVAARALFGAVQGGLPGVDAVGGHSVGEWAAAVLAGVLEETDALRLVGVRGRAMAAACADAAGSLAAVLGGDAEVVGARLSELGLTGANFNGAGQIVAGGPLAAIDALVAQPPQGARVRRLQVAGAFHTPAMEPAVQALRSAADGVRPRDPRPLLLSNADGAFVASGVEMLGRMVAQVATPVRWDRCQQTLAAAGITALIELAPSGALAGLAKRELPGVRVLALDGPAKLDEARALLAEAGQMSPV